jgi:hypothetical protein
MMDLFRNCPVSKATAASHSGMKYIKDIKTHCREDALYSISLASDDLGIMLSHLAGIVDESGHMSRTNAGAAV